ncbi:MAG: molecular chaperone TorD family protein, partial [Candidatus Binatia bacterium]
AYRFFAAAFDYPDEDLVQAIRAGELVETLRTLLGAASPGVIGEIDWEALAIAGGDDDLAVDYTRLFDVGVSGPPCSLYGGMYNSARMQTMEEAVRFYNHFGLTLSESPRELPDHLTTELEFLHFLAYREAEAIEQGEDAGPFRRAQRDFVERHPGRWVPELRARLEKNEPPPFLRALVDSLARFLARDQAHLVGLVGPAPA